MQGGASLAVRLAPPQIPGNPRLYRIEDVDVELSVCNSLKGASFYPSNRRD